MFEDLNPEPSTTPVPAESPGTDSASTGPAQAPSCGSVSNEPVPSGEPEPAAPAFAVDEHLADWKDSLRADFERWLAGLETLPEPESEQAWDQPDLYSFYEQLAAANTEARKANRRTAEAISQWGDTLVRFEHSLTPLRETIAQLTAAQPKTGQLTRTHCLALIEMLDRLERIAKAFQSPPPKFSWWPGRDAAWRKSWDAQCQAFDIVVSHLAGLLKKEGVTRLNTEGQPFDPTMMTAVAVEQEPSRPPQTVLEEVAPGYSREGDLLRPAQVKVNNAML